MISRLLRSQEVMEKEIRRQKSRCSASVRDGRLQLRTMKKMLTRTRKSEVPHQEFLLRKAEAYTADSINFI